ncbi:GNAT family N-acetyltransferase [Cognatishimia sp. WU-CL00825]|uniref:GNAT family N-acetyltransferase n=1 Tax=Cognatishimia sp. WU-CL00825 TaxID=3127658 RepID=UPI003109D790
MTQAPTLTTGRLILRAHGLDDFPDMAKMWADPDVVRYISGKPSTHPESWARFLRNIGHWEMLGFGYWLVADKTTGAFLGEVGFADFQRDMTPSFAGMPEAGWVMTTASHGKGLAQEAMQCILNWADATLTAQHSVCMISPDHQASIRLAEKLGFGDKALANYLGEPVLTFKRNRPS